MADDREAEVTEEQWNIEQILCYVWQLCAEEGQSEQEYPFSSFDNAEGGGTLRKQLNGLLAVERDREQRWLNLFSDYELPCESFEQAEKIWNSLPQREREVTERPRRETLEEAARVVDECNDSIKNGNETSHPKHIELHLE